MLAVWCAKAGDEVILRKCLKAGPSERPWHGVTPMRLIVNTPAKH
jgi:hypothetical protein